MHDLWHGTVQATGYLFDEALMGRAALVERLRGLWADGARLGRLERWWVLWSLPPRWVDSRGAPGAPLTARDGRLLAGPVTDEQLATAPRDALWLVEGGDRRWVSLSSVAQVHPATLLELPLPPVREVEALSPPVRPLVARAPLARAGVDDLFAPMLEAVARAAPVPRPSPWQRLRRWLSDAMGQVRPRAAAGSWWARQRARLAPPRREGLVRDPPAPVRAAQPGPLTRLWRRLTTNPHAQERYLEDLRRRFHEGDLAEALRRAVPLTSRRDGPGGPAGVASVPTRRDSLSLLAPRAVGAPAMVMPGDEFAAMRAMYKEAADALIAQGRVEEAAYVLSKLLEDGQAAVALLEKHQRFSLAAQLATVHGLSEVERMRLWLLAGDTREAIRIARRSANFSVMVSALGTRAPALALRLRGLWAEHLASHHRFAEAVTVSASLTQAPEGFTGWVDHAVDAGGAAAVTALAVELGRKESPRRAAQRGRLDALLDADEALAPRAAEALLTHAPQSGTLLRDTWRRLMRQASGGAPVDPRLVSRVLAQAGDPALTADGVPPPTFRGVRARAPIELGPPLTASLPVVDVAALPKRRRVTAHGSAGLRVVDAEGAVLRHLLVKADALVAGPVGAPVLVLSLDGALMRVWRLDPVSFALAEWFQSDAPTAFSRRYDGLAWPLATADALVLLDPIAPGPMEWWRTPDVHATDVDMQGPYVFVRGKVGPDGDGLSVFNASSQQRVSRYATGRGALAGPRALAWTMEQSPMGFYVVRDLGTNRGSTALDPGPWSTSPVPNALVLTQATAGGSVVWAMSWARMAPVQVATLPGVTVRVVRELGEKLLGVADDRGRVVELPLDLDD